jgi:hypothetical protein
VFFVKDLQKVVKLMIQQSNNFTAHVKVTPPQHDYKGINVTIRRNQKILFYLGEEADRRSIQEVTEHFTRAHRRKRIPAFVPATDKGEGTRLLSLRQTTD